MLTDTVHSPCEIVDSHRADSHVVKLVAAAFVCAVKLVIMPVLVWMPTHFMALPTWRIEVMVPETAMPSAMLAVKNDQTEI